MICISRETLVPAGPKTEEIQISMETIIEIQIAVADQEIELTLITEIELIQIEEIILEKKIKIPVITFIIIIGE